MKTIKMTGRILFALATLVALSVPASANVYNFQCITNNNPLTDCTAAMGAQLSIEVVAVGGSQARFIFRNNVGIVSSLTDIYFDDGSNNNNLRVLGGIAGGNAGLTPSAGVSFSLGASPPNLPGGNDLSPAFLVTAGLLADSDAPITANGINASTESLGILFNLAAGKSFNDVIHALDSGFLRVGVRVQGFTSGGSEAFVNIVPEPGFYTLLTLGLGGLFLAARRRRTQP